MGSFIENKTKLLDNDNSRNFVNASKQSCNTKKVGLKEKDTVNDIDFTLKRCKSFLTIYLLTIDDKDSIDVSDLKENEKKVVLSYKRKEDQLMKFAASLLIDKYLKAPIEKNGYGKPFILSGPNISISDCYPYVLLVISNYLVGVDIEKELVFSKNLINQCFTNKEINQKIDYTLLWTMKEASYKLNGNKEFVPLIDEIILKNENCICFDKNEYYLLSKKMNDYYYSVVLENKPENMELINVSYQDLIEERRCL